MKQFVILFFSLAAITTVYAKPIEVHVAAYDYPPYFAAEHSHHLVGDITAALNALQNNYQFNVVHIAPNARYDALSASGCCDLMLFEDPSWGWNLVEYSARFTTPLYKDQERFVARKAINRGQSFFAVNGLRFGGIVGYHYAFAENEKDNRVLEEKYGIYLAHSHQINLRMLLNNRLDLIMLADAYIRSVLTDEIRDELLISEQAYGEHKLSAVTNRDKNIDADILASLLEQLKTNGTLEAIFAKHGL